MFEALNVACVVGPVLAVAWLMLRLTITGSSQVLLCMECEQCARACPVSLKAGPDFTGPRGIMSAAKVGNPAMAIEHGALQCNSCKACQHVCPRGLAPYQEVEHWRNQNQHRPVLDSRQDLELIRS